MYQIASSPSTLTNWSSRRPAGGALARSYHTPSRNGPAARLPTSFQISPQRNQQQAEEALAKGNYGLIFEGSALNFAELIAYFEPNNPFAVDMRDRVRRAAHQAAQNAVARGDLAQGQEVYKFLIDFFPYDEEARVAAARLENQLAARRGKVGEFVRKAEEAQQSEATRLRGESVKAREEASAAGESAAKDETLARQLDQQLERARQEEQILREQGVLQAGEATVADARLEIGFNSRYLLDITEQIAGTEARFLMADAGPPTLVRDGADEGALYVLMPMRV